MHDPIRDNSHKKDTQSAFALSDIGIEDQDLRVEMFTLCESATEQDGRLSLLSTYDIIKATQFPCLLLQVTVVLRVRFWPDETRSHVFRLSVTDPDGIPVGSPVEVTAELRPLSEESSAAYNLITRFQNVEIGRPGEYTFDFHLDGKIEGRLPVCVGSAA